MTVGTAPFQTDAAATSIAAAAFSGVTPDTVDRNARSGSVADTANRPSCSQVENRPTVPSAAAAPHASVMRAKSARSALLTSASPVRALSQSWRIRFLLNDA
jgi:hypothetical protein